ncbi:hypothetical protein [Exiguobacterium artemiae]|uniref:hypothetical protein n=1 Tax=Exiguobacterium artemiae TaxID=340145 RepID=UPI000045F102|nr:hypothetical protein [Exiguobacterium sibiricum]
MAKPMPTPSNGLSDVTSVTPKPMAEPIKLNVIKSAKNDTTPAMMELQEMLRPAPSGERIWRLARPPARDVL